MSIRPPRSAATEHVISAVSGWPMLIVNLLLFAAAPTYWDSAPRRPAR